MFGLGLFTLSLAIVKATPTRARSVMTSSGCCPTNSLGSLFDFYTEGGTKQTLEPSGLEYYSVGSTSSTKAIIIAPDVFGWDTGRVRRIADSLSTRLNVNVIIPKLLTPALNGGTDGDGLPPGYDLGNNMEEFMSWIVTIPFEDNIKPKVGPLLEHLSKQGVESIGMIGICWGGWCFAKCAGEFPQVKCGAVVHPSMGLEGKHGGTILEIAKKIHIPVLFCPAGNDDATYSPGGEVFEAVKANAPSSSSTPFPDMTHGFFTRGDGTKENVKNDVSKAFELVEAFFKLHL